MSSGDPETRKRILNETWRLMEEQRGQGVKVRDIARAADVSRQAVYLHFGSRAELLTATARHVDEVKNLRGRLQALYATTSGVRVLEAFVDFWGNYIPEIYGLAKALLAMRETDEAANAAWEDRMEEMRTGCRNAVACLERDQILAPEWNSVQAAEMMFTLLSITVWEELTISCGWSKKQYIEHIQVVLKRTFVKSE